MNYYKLKILNNKWKILIIVFFLIIICGLIIYYIYFYNDEYDDDLDNNFLEPIYKVEIKSEDKVNDEEYMYVDIKGYVNNPGVYSFLKNSNTRINDLILKAGGLKKDADTSMINLSKKLEDEMTIIIYSKSEVKDYIETKKRETEKIEMCNQEVINDSCIKNEIISDKININTSSKELLMTLEGIGDSKAQLIIDYRKNIPFEKIEDIMNVSGIGESIFIKIKENITV